MKHALQGFGNAIISAFSNLPSIIGNFPAMIEAEAKRSKEEKERKARNLLRNFRIEITSTFWGTTKKMIQRERPLTDQELDHIITLL